MYLINWGPSVNVDISGIIWTASFLNPSLSLLYLRFGLWWKLKGRRWPGRLPSVWLWMASWSECQRFLVWRSASMLLFHTTSPAVVLQFSTEQNFLLPLYLKQHCWWNSLFFFLLLLFKPCLWAWCMCIFVLTWTDLCSEQFLVYLCVWVTKRFISKHFSWFLLHYVINIFIDIPIWAYIWACHRCF